MSELSPNLHRVIVQDSGFTFHIDSETNLLDAFKKNNIYIKTTCGGFATCSDCIIKIVAGENFLNPPNFAELSKLGNVFHITRERLACQTYITGDIMVDLSGHNKDADEAQFKNKFKKKNTPKIIIKKKSDIESYKKTGQKTDKNSQQQKEKNPSWERYWEKNNNDKNDKNKKDDKTKHPKRLGGGRRPKPFKYDNENDDD